MGLFKVSLALIVLLITLASIHSSSAQNTRQDYLTLHNAARKQVGVRAIEWSDRLAADAHDYALKMQRANTCHKLVPSKGQGHRYGENKAAGKGYFTGRQAVNTWVSEKRYYNYRSNSCVGGNCRHYTQVVWQTSVVLGCSRIRCNSGWWFVICYYAYPGNVAGQRPY